MSRLRNDRDFARRAGRPLAAAIAVETDPERCRLGIDALRELEPAAVLPLLQQNTSAPQPAVRACAVLVLGSFPERPDADVAAAVAVIERVYERDPHPAVRRRAAVALLARGDRRGVENFPALLRDPDADLRRRALAALVAATAPGDWLPHVAEALEDEDGRVRGLALSLLAERRPSGCGPMLIQRLRSSREARTRVAAAAAIATLVAGKDAEALRALREGSTDREPRVRWFSGAGLLRQGIPDAAEEVAAGMTGAAESDRYRLLELLLGAPAELAAPHLARALDDPARPVGLRALVGLAERRDGAFAELYRAQVIPRLVAGFPELPGAGALLTGLVPEGPWSDARLDGRDASRTSADWWIRTEPSLRWNAERRAFLRATE
ncbi:MAG: HEAT repeat domain-containing protein [Planctomycetes bacterium]|nr:HEAT repeat domain-containing protein [Planctomycetota bacterium]